MTEDEQPRERWSPPEDWPEESTHEDQTAGDRSPTAALASSPVAASTSAADGKGFASSETLSPGLSLQPSDSEPALFQNYEVPRLPERIPHFGHLLLLGAIVLFGLLFTGLMMQIALHYRMFGVSSMDMALTDIHYTLASEAVLYLFTLIVAFFIFPLMWHKRFFAGLQWNAATAFRLRWQLMSAAVACLLLAAVSSYLFPGPTNTPIDKIFRAPGAAWLLFGFGITFAPFFEEMLFRGFLLPALCTVVDWFGEKIVHRPRPPLGPSGHPQWSFGAMTIAAVVTSVPFAWMHAEQTGYAIGPFVLLCGVSLVLCAVRLATRSLASSVLVHGCYNFVLFSIMLVGTQGFRHLDKM